MKNENLLAHIFESIDACIIVIDTHKNVLLTNKSFYKKLNITDTDIINAQKCNDLFDKCFFSCNSDKNFCPFEEVSLTKKHIKTIHQYRDDNNINRYIELSITPLYEDKTIYGFVEIRHDVTNHIYVNETLKEKRI